MKYDVVELPIDSLKPDSRNPRRMSRDAFEKLQLSLDQFGMPQPIIVNRRTGLMIGGHQRLEAARELQWDTVPVTYMDLDDDNALAFGIALNNREAQGTMDDDALAEIISGLDEDARLLTLYNDEQIAKLQDGPIEHDEVTGKPKAQKKTSYSIETLRTLRNAYVEHAGVQDPQEFIAWLESHENNS